MPSAISRDLLRAYEETDYIVSGAHGFVLRIGVASPALGALYRQRRVQCAAFVTACYPYSQPVSPADNRRAHARLRSWLDHSRYAYIDGRGTGPDHSWPAEASFLVLGLPLAQARALGKDYRQNAIVWCGSDTVPRLVLLR